MTDILVVIGALFAIAIVTTAFAFGLAFWIGSKIDERVDGARRHD